MVRLDETDPRLIPTMKCTVEILVGEVKNALLVPKNAVFPMGEQKVCFVKKGEGHEKRVVETGKTDGKKIVIRKGLTGGEEILLTKPADPK